MNKKPCDMEDGTCPFEANGYVDCYNNCGVGASEENDYSSEQEKEIDCQQEGKIKKSKPCLMDGADWPNGYSHCICCDFNCWEDDSVEEVNALTNDTDLQLREQAISPLHGIKLIVHMEGGIVQSVLLDSNNSVDVMVMEFDDQSEADKDAIEVMNHFVGDSIFREIGHKSALVPDDYKVEV
ncbi:MAG: hypothetical protein JEZ08_16385 [Clostridiales bacterium]|nr:hypothetical protein [Clostridiales bacterium]